MTIVEVQYEDGDRDAYFVPLAICSAPDARGVEERSAHAVLARLTGARKGVLFDGWLDDRFARTLLDALEHREEIRTRRGSIVSAPAQAFQSILGTSELRIGRMSAEQSNTSLLYGDRLILKLFRRLQPGINPDYEISCQLTERMGFTRVPRVAGAFEYRMPAEQPITIGMLQEFVESQADGWRHATDELGRFYEEVEGRAAPEDKLPASFDEMLAAEPPPSVRELMGGYLGTAEILGRRTAEMHLALASDTSAPAFAPEPFTREDLAAVTADAAVQATKAVETLKKALSSSAAAGGLPDDVAARARELSSAQDRLFERLRSGPALEFSVSKIRIHGDYHLGQVLWAEGDFYLLDFEGEPARPIEQRRQKQSPMKDVAGMLRSYSYAAFAGLFAHAATRSAQFAQLEPWARIWQVWACTAFLKAYLGTAGNALFVPADGPQRDALLQLFILDKALYELNYELNNRPEWVRIPILGILDILQAG
jgi:maltose alpha-D-glucosyltransferase/alpha-amylase